MERSEPHFGAFEEDANPPSRAAVRLAAALAERLAAVVPAPFRVGAEGGWVVLHRGDVWDGSSDVAGGLDQEVDPTHPYHEPRDEDWSLADRAAMVAEGVLSSVQDAVSEATAEPWPALPGRRMAMPGTRTDGASVYLWYGPDEDAAVLAFAPIRLAALLAPG
jgi:hypothetical protein